MNLVHLSVWLISQTADHLLENIYPTSFLSKAKNSGKIRVDIRNSPKIWEVEKWTSKEFPKSGNETKETRNKENIYKQHFAVLGYPTLRFSQWP